MIRNLILLLFLIGLWALVSCSSSQNNKYSLLDENDKVEIKQLCECFSPLHDLVKKWNSATDSVELEMIMDTLDVKMKNLKPCLDKAKNLKTKSENDTEFEKQVTAYIREKYADCYELITGKRKTNKLK